MKQDSWLYSDSFIKRAFAIWGYHTVASLIIAIPFIVLWIVFMAWIFRTLMQEFPWEQLQQVPIDMQAPQ